MKAETLSLILYLCYYISILDVATFIRFGSLCQPGRKPVLQVRGTAFFSPFDDISQKL